MTTPSEAKLSNLGIAAQAWTAPSTEHLTMIPELAVEFAKYLDLKDAEILALRSRLEKAEKVIEAARSLCEWKLTTEELHAIVDAYGFIPSTPLNDKEDCVVTSTSSRVCELGTKCSKFEDKQNHKPTPSEAKRKHKSFDADIRYRNLLIGLSREITHLEKMQAQNEADGKMSSKPYAKAFGITAQRLRIVISTNGRAMNYYFGVKNPQDIYGQEIIKDNTDE